MRLKTNWTAHQVTEDLAMIHGHGLGADRDVFEEVRYCPELMAVPDVRAAIVDADAAVARALRIATIEKRDYVAAWMAYAMADRLLQSIEDILVFAGVVAPEHRLRDDGTTAAEWMAMFQSYADSGLAWEMREVSR